MKKSIKIIIAILVIIIIAIFVYYKTNKTPVVTENSIVGCYMLKFNKDVYTLNILSQQGELFEGKLVFKNFEKDSSSGTYKGTYKNGILLGDYSFNSEGMDSVMQVIFKKIGNDFVRGFGEVDSSSGTRFTDLNNITYNPSLTLSLFKASTETCATSL